MPHLSNELYIIVEYNGSDYIALVLNPRGEVETFKNERIAKTWAEGNLAFNYKIVRLY